MDQVNWYLDRDTIKLGERSVGYTKGREEMSVISEDFFDEGDFRKIQNVANINPLNVFMNYMDEMGTTVFPAGDLARLINPVSLWRISRPCYSTWSSGGSSLRCPDQRGGDQAQTGALCACLPEQGGL
ncbi:MAG: hypothetical protein R2787_12490 [Saprospiraceae bacterium]